MSLIRGLELPFGIKPIEATPVDAWSGPYISVEDALSSIPVPVRYVTMQVNVTGETEGSKIYWFKNGTSDEDLIPMIDMELQKGLTGETRDRISGDTALYNQITGETAERTLSDIILKNDITGLTKTVLDNYNQLTGETSERIQSDNDINDSIEILRNQLTGETAERISTDEFIYNNLTGLTQSFEETIDLFNTEVTARNIADNELQGHIDETNLRIDGIDSEIINIYNEISGGSGEFHDMVTGETAARISGDTSLQNQITGLTDNLTGLTKTVSDNYSYLNNAITAETASRIASDNALTNTDNDLRSDISGLTDTVSNNYEYNQNLIYIETFNRTTGDTSLRNLITGETKNRQDADIALSNNITAETFNRITGDTSLRNQITGETKNRQDADSLLDMKIADIAASIGAMSGDTSLYNKITGETAARISGDTALETAIINATETCNTNFSLTNDSISGLTQIVNENYIITNNLITGETHNREISDIILNNSITALTETVESNYNILNNTITGETANRIQIDSDLDNRIGLLEEQVGIMSGDTSLNDMITGETFNRITGDTNLNNQITGLTKTVNDYYAYNQGLITSETQNRISGDTELHNQITGLSETLTNDLMANFAIHTGNTSVHITPAQNTLLDGITGVTFTEINYLNGLTGNTQNQINSKSNTGHTHYALYDQSGTTEILYIDAGKNLHVTGDLLVSGTTYETHAETLYIKDNYIYLREGAVAGLTNGNYTGIEAIKYDGVNNGRLVFDYLGTARVGTVGQEQPLLTRAELSGMTDGHLAIWSSSGHRVNTIDPLNLPVSNATLNKISDEELSRISGDTSLYNQITGETKSRQDADTALSNNITAETFNRITGDTSLRNQITGLTSAVNDYYTYNQGLITSETQNRISGDTSLYNQITGETKNRQDADTVLSNSITAETFNRITGDTSLRNQITGETFARVTGDTSLYNQITGETKNRQDGDIILSNILTGLTSNYNQHTGDTSMHLSSSQNVLLDGITGVTFTEINYLNGLTGNTQNQINSKSNTGHTHTAIYHPTGTTKVVYVDENGDVHVNGDIYQSGTTYSTHTEEIYTKNNYIILRDGATSALSDGIYTGIEAVKYDGVNNGRLAFDNTGTARVGDIGSEQPLVTRNEASGMTDGGLVYWSSSDSKVKTSNYNINDIVDTFINSTGDTMTGDLISTAFIKSGATSNDFLKGDGSIDSTVYEPILPSTPENPKSKFLNGNKTWSEIAVGGKGYTANLYLSNEDSDIIGYKKILSDYDSNQSLFTITVRNDLGEVLGETFLYDEPIEVTHIDDGVWSSAFGTMVSSSDDNTVVKIVCFVRTTGGTENVLFTGYTDTIENISMEMLFSESKQRNFTVNPSDRLGIRVYGLTDSSSIRTITYGVGGIYSSYFNTPLPVRHTNLRGLNNDPNYQHLTFSEKEEIVTTGRTINAGPGMIGGGNLSDNITISHADTSNASDLSAMANFNGTVIQDLEVKLDTYGHVTGHTVYNYDLDNRYYTESESDNRFVNVTGGTVNGNIEANGALIDYVEYKTGSTVNLAPGIRRLNTEMGTTELQLVGHDITLQDGFEMLGWGYNDSDYPILNGCPITSSGNTISVTGATTIMPAIASDADNTLYRVVGITTENIPAHSYGIFCILGEVHDLDLSAFENGEDIFLSQTEAGKFVGKNELSINGRISEIGRVLNNSATNGVLFIQLKNEFGVSNNTQFELETFAGNNTSTGAFYCEGISIPSKTGVTFNVGTTRGWVVDNETNPLKPHIKYVVYNATTGLTTPFLNTNTITYILLKEDGTLYFSPSFPTPIERRQMIFIGNVGHANKSNISTAVNNIDIMISPFSQTRDLLSTIPVINGGIYSSPNGDNLYFNTSGGYLYSFGINFSNNPSDPTKLFVTGSTQSWFAYRTSTGGTSTMTQTIDPGNYEVNGVITSLSNNNYYTNQRIYMIRDGELRVQYGQKAYDTIDAAINAISSESFITFEALKNDAVLIGILTVKGNATDLSDVVQARFTQVSRFGEVAGAAGGISVSTLQGAYTNGSNPEIITNQTLGALTIKRGSNSDNDNVLEIQDGLGITTASINGSGDITGSSITISGGSSNQFLKADGSLDSSLYLTADNSGHTHEDLYYNKSLSDERYVNVTGDTMSGKLNITSGGISVTGVSTGTTIFYDSLGNTVLRGKNTGDQDLSGLSTYNYVNATFSRTGHTHTGVYEPLKGSDDNYVTDSQLINIQNLSGVNTGDETASTIKTKLGITTLSGVNTGDETTATIKSKLGITVLSGDNTGDQDLDNLATYDYVNSTFSKTGHTHVDEYDLRYVNVTGDTMTGSLTAASFIKNGGTASQFLKADGSSDSNSYSLSSHLHDNRYSLTGHTHDDRYYTETESDNRFVNTTGDTMTGKLNITSGGISVTGVTTGTTIFYDSLGNEVLKGRNTGDQDLSGLSTYNYVNATFSRTGHTHTGVYEPLKGSDDNYVTDSQLINIQNLSGVNTGDETANSIKTKLGITTLSGVNTGDETTATIKSKLGITVLSGDNTGDQDLSNLATYTYVNNTFSTTGHTHVDEYDLRYVNVTGDTMTGPLTATSFIKNGGTSSQFLKADGSSDSNSYSLSSHLHDDRYSLTGHTHDDRYYTETESDSRFVNVTGDTISGKINITSGGISVTGVTTGTTIFYDSLGNDVLKGKNTGDQDLSGLATYTYVNNTFSKTGHTHTGVYEPLKGSDDYYVTSTEKIKLSNLSGVNTGDETASSIKTKLGITTLSGVNTGDETTATIKYKLGITILSGDNTGDQDLSNLATYAYVNNTFSTTGHTHIPEYDLRYVNATGDTMTGSLTATSFVKTGSNGNELLLGNGGVKNVANYETAYNYSQIGHLPLSGGTVNGSTNFTNNLSINGNTIQNYSLSKGENLITNGSGILGNNTNFSQLTFDGSNAYYSTGSFTGSFTGGAVKYSDELFPVEIDQTYNCTFNAKSKLGTGTFYFMPIFYDADSLPIYAYNHMYKAGTTTTLAQDLKPGDTKVYLTNSANWYNIGTDGFADYLRSIIFWDYTNSFGYLYPAETYSRNYYAGMWAPGGISGNTITLKTAWTGPTKVAGTKLSNGNDAANHKYFIIVGNTIPTGWTSYSGVISGLDLSGQNVSNKFVPGTAKCRIGWLWNHNSASGEQAWFTNLSFSKQFNNSGGKIYGSVTANSFIKEGGTSSQFLKADGSIDSNVYVSSLTSGHTHDDRYYTKAISDSKYATLSGSTFTGSISATNLSGNNTGDQDLSSLSTYSYVNSTFSTTGHTHTGIYEPLKGSDDNYVTDNQLINIQNLSGINTGDETASTIKTKLGITTLSGANTGDETASTIKTKLGITTLSGANTGDQDLSNLATYTYVNNTFSTTGHSHDNLYVNVDGDTMTGSLTATSFIKNGGTASQFLKADGSSDSNSYSLSSHLHDDRYYTESEADSRFVSVTGDSINGALSINGNLSVTGVTTGTTIFYDSVGNTVLKGRNTGDQDLSGLSTYNYVNATFSRTGHTHTGVYEPLKGADDNYVTDAQLINIQNLSGVNTGDETASSIKTKLGITTLSGVNTGDETATSIKTKLGITTLSGSNTGDQDLSSLATYTYVNSTFSGTGHTHVPEYDLRYVNVTGDAMTGSLTATSFVKNGGNSNQFLKADGSSDSNSYSLSSHLHDDRYYTESESDTRFVNVTGDTISKLIISGNTSGTTLLDIQGVNGQLFSVTDNLVGDVFAVSDITGIPILKVNSSGKVTIDGMLTANNFSGSHSGTSTGNNTGDQDLSGLSTYNYVNATFSRTGHTHTGVYEPLKGSDDNYVTDTQLINIQNLSGTNTGDETISTIKSKLGITTLSGSNTGDETTATIKTKLGISTLSGSNTGDQDLSHLSTYDYVNNTFSPTTHNHDSAYVNVTGDTMTGDLFINSATNSNSITTGSIRTIGGIGATGNAYIGGNLHAGVTYTPNIMVGNNGAAGKPTILLAIGDTDSGLHSTSDGTILMYGNNVNIGNWNTDALSLSVPCNASNFKTGGWFRSTGNVGWYNETYGGGIYMEDTTYVKVFNNKKFAVYNTADDSIVTTGGIYASGPIHGSNLSGTNTGDQDLSNLATYTYVNNTFSTTSHKHFELYTPNGATQSLFVDSAGNVHVLNDLYLSGSTYNTNAETLNIAANYIYLREGATAGMAAGEYAGIEAIKYDGTYNGRLVFDNSGTARVGDVGSEQPLATRDEVGSMTSNGFVYWDSASGKLKTNTLTTTNISSTYYTQSAADSRFVNVTGDTMTGKLTISSGGITAAGVSSTAAIFTDSVGGVVLKGVNTGDQDLSNLATYTYVNSTFSTTGHTHTGVYQPIMGSNDNYVTDSQLINIQNLSGTNTGDETAATIRTKLGITTLSGSNTGDQDLSHLSTYDYVNNTFSTTNHNHDSAYVNVTGDTMTGDLFINSATNSNSITTGSIRTIGGVGVAGNAFIGGNLYAGETHIPNAMIGNNGHAGKPTILLAIGDNDSGLHSVSDGVIQMYANNISIGNWNSGNFNLNVNTNINGTVRTSGVFSAGEGQDDSYGYVNVCRDNTINNASCFSWVRAGISSFGLGFNTSDQIVMGNASTYNNKTINPWITIGSSVVYAPGNIQAAGTITGRNLSGTNTGDQDLSNLATYTYVNNTFSTTSHNHDSIYVNVGGDTMTGTLNGTNAVYSSTIQATTGKFTNLTDGYIPYHASDVSGLVNSNIYYDGTNVGIGTNTPSQAFHVYSTTNYQGILVNGSNVPSVCFASMTETTPRWKIGLSAGNDTYFSISKGNLSDNKLVISAAGNLLIGTDADSDYKLDVNGTGRFTGTLIANNLSGTNTGDQDLSNLATYTYVNATFLNANTGGTISGPVVINDSTVGDTVFSINGSTGQLFSVSDNQEGTLFHVSDISGIPILQVDSTGYIAENSGQMAGMTTTTTIYELDKLAGSAAYIDYRVMESSTRAFRAGTLMVVWDSINNVITYTDSSTPDLTASSDGIKLSTIMNGSYVQIIATITSGTWNTKLGVRVI